MKKSFYLLSFFLFSHSCFAQHAAIQQESGVTGTVHQIFTPTVKIASKTTVSTDLPFNFSIATNPFYTANKPLIDACIAIAGARWSHALLSSDPTGNLSVNIHVVFADLGWPATDGSYTIMETLPIFHHDDFTYANPGEEYVQSLANFIMCKKAHTTGNFFGGNDMTITVNTNSAIASYYHFDPGAACPTDKRDFLTNFTHEICHGLGLITSAAQGFSGLNLNAFGPDSKPAVLDPYINDQGTGSTCGGAAQYLEYLFFSHNSHFSSFCQSLGGYETSCNASNNSVFCNTYSTPVRLDAENPFVEGASLEHLYENVPVTSPTDNDELMQPYYSKGNQLMISNADLLILNAIGWDLTPAVGFEDYVQINDPASGCIGTPNQILDLGTTNHYCQGGPAMIDYSTALWTIKLYAEDGIQTIATQSTGINWDLTLSEAELSGHIWKRDINGRIQGVLTFTASGYITAIGVGVNYIPQNLLFNLKNTSDYWCQCDKEQLSFYAPGATSYLISKRAQFLSGTWSAWSAPITVADGIYSYTFTGLNQYDNYQFQVQAINSLGTITSNIIGRNHCANYVLVNPNPGSATAYNINISVNPPSISGGIDATDQTDASITDATLGMDNVDNVVISNPDPCGPRTVFLISGISLTNVSNSQISYNYTFDGTTSSVQLNTQSMQSGIYALSVTSIDGIVATTSFEVDNN